jgi:endonuclease/exonuclease/phosphatase family metal-dependent hydrolase
VKIKSRVLIAGWTVGILCFSEPAHGSIAGGVTLAKETQNVEPKPESTLRVLSWNLWDGTNQKGYLKLGEHESPLERETRHRKQAEQLGMSGADLIFLQEVSPVFKRARALADALGMHQISRGDNCGIKIGSMGLPTNLQNGLVILAKPELQLTLTHLEPKSLTEGQFPNLGWGFCHSWGSFQLGERSVYLAGTVRWKGKEIVVVNTHLYDFPEALPENESRVEVWEDQAILDSQASSLLRSRMQKADTLREEAGKHLLSLLEPLKAPVVLAGDLNASPESPLLKTIIQKGFHDLSSDLSSTWSPTTNPLIDQCIELNQTLLKPMTREELFVQASHHQPRKLDYILTRGQSVFERRSASLTSTDASDFVWLSDHFGVLVDLY